MKLLLKVCRSHLGHILWSLFFIFSSSAILNAQSNYDILKDWFEWSDGNNMLIHSINKQAIN